MADKYLNYDGMLYFWQKLKAYFVAKEAGKGLSTNDYTTEDKTKLAGLSNYTLPTASTSTLGGVKVDGSTINIVNGVISAVGGVSFQRVTSLPATGTTGIIYLLPQSDTSADNVYDEYIWCDTDGSGTMGWEQIGTTAIDLSGYMLKTDMAYVTNAEIDTVVAS